MSNQTNIKNVLKTLPLSVVLAAGLALSPVLAQADNANRVHHQQKYSVSSAKQHNKGHKNNHRQGSKHHYDKGHGRHIKHAKFKPGYHKHRYDHRVHNHSHIKYVVNDHYHGDDYNDLEHLSFMIGLHTGNLDIILRE